MPVDRIKKKVFIHIPKTAGTSVEVSMNIIQYSGEDDINLNIAGKNSSSEESLFGNSVQHWSAIEVCEKLISSGCELKDFNFFTVLRDPSDRLLSHYLGRKKGWLKSSQKPVNNILAVIIFLAKLSISRIIISTTPNGRQRFLKKRLYSQYEHIRSQCSYIRKCPMPIELWDFARLDKLSSKLENSGYKPIPKYRVNKRIPSKLVQTIIRIYTKIFYFGDHRLYNRIKESKTPCLMVNGAIHEAI